MSTKWTKHHLPIIGHQAHKHSIVPIKRSVLFDTNKYNPRTCRRDREATRQARRMARLHARIAKRFPETLDRLAAA